MMIHTSMKTWRLGLISPWKRFWKGHIYHPLFNSRVQNWKKFNPRNFWGELLGSQPKSSKFQSSNPQKKRDENVKEKEVSK